MNRNYILNGGIYQYEDKYISYILTLSSFLSGDTVLAVPFYSNSTACNIPARVGDKVMYMAYREIFRARKEHLSNLIGVMDSFVIEMIARGIYSSIRGNLSDVLTPEAILINAPVCERNKKEQDMVAEIKVPIKQYKYTLDDYRYIINNYNDNMEGIIAKYGLNSKETLYRLKYSLQKRFGESVEVPGGTTSPTENICEQETEEGE